MKKVLSFVLMICTVLMCVPAFAVASTAASLPASATLVGTQFLPPVSNQGAVGCCASEAIAYLQFSNAIARYKYSLDPSTSWKPSTGNAAYCMFPGYTYNLAGAGTAWVYEVLKEQGVFPQTVQTFSNGVTGFAYDDYRAKTWATGEGNWDIAQNYRIKNYDQVWIGNAPYYYEITTTSTGRALIDRIKQNIIDGNVVVTGGYPDRWVTDVVRISNTGTLGKTGEHAIPYSTNVPSGGHNVAIVGYDDNITCTKNGVTLKGAFLVQNSWGTGWQDSGRIWMMYDALNEVSPYAALNVSNRTWTMDQFGFLDWKSDLDLSTPELMVKLTIGTTNRDSFTVSLTRTDRKTGSTESYTPYIMSNMWQRIDYNEGYNFGGTKSAAMQYGVLTFNYNALLDTMQSGKTIDDYIWGMKVSPANGGTAVVQALRLVKNGSTVYTQGGLYDTVSGSNSAIYSLDTTRLIGVNVPNGVTVTPKSGRYTGESGENFSFTVDISSGYKATAAFTVTVNGKILLPENGVYTFTVSEKQSNIVCVNGVIPKTVTEINMGTYGSGFETYGSGNDREFIFMPSFDNSCVPDCYADLCNGNLYGFTFRITVNGVTYEVAPESNYNFGSWCLYRLPVAKCGWVPQNGSGYSLSVEVCYNGIPFMKDSYIYVSCSVSPEKAYATHVHSFNSGRYITVEGSSCRTHGSGYEYCSVAGCCAVKAVSLPYDNNIHSFRDPKLLLENATSSTPGKKGYCCSDCSYKYVTETFTAKKCDTTGDDEININDVTRLLDYLAKRTDTVACGADLTGDGLCTVKDLSYLLLVLEGRIIL